MLKLKTLFFSISLLVLVTIFVPNKGYTSETYEVSSYYQSVDLYDPYEKFNRKVFSFNKALDKAIARPITKVYQKVIPKWGRERVGSFFRNLATPITFINDILQGNKNNSAFISFWRFTLNSTIGIGGLFDIAEVAGLKHNKEDFGQTLGMYGAKPGPYLMLPILGPSTVRDFAGTVVDTAADPFNYILPRDYLYAKTGGNLIHTRSEKDELIEDIERTSLDPYATIRSLYLQSRANSINNNKYNLPNLNVDESKNE
jgi:phospholipid-binding lipoprotein MlaA